MTILESTSSWFSGLKLVRQMGLLERTCSPLFTTRTLSGHKVTNLSARNPKSSVLLSLSRRKLLQLGGSLILSVNLRRSPLPLYSLTLLQPSGLKSSSHQKLCLPAHALTSMSVSLGLHLVQHILQRSLMSLEAMHTREKTRQ